MHRKLRKVCVVTGSRADYGLLRWLMHEIDTDERLALQVAATGSHLSHQFGFTAAEIEADGFRIDAKVDMLMLSDTPEGIAKSIGLGVIGFADALTALKPDILILLGDRYEVFAAAIAAMTAHIPIAHLHGGETTEAAIDEAIRHAITKMAHLHFVATEAFGKRVAQLGESPNSIFSFGAPAADALERMELLSRDELERQLGFSLKGQIFLVTYHPVTLETADPSASLNALFQALDAFDEAKVVITGANADQGGRLINSMIEAFERDRPGKVLAIPSLGRLRYLSMMKIADAVVGNSSSGIIEAPMLKTATVNIGHRQDGRPRATSVIDCDDDADAIFAALTRATSPSFRAALPSTQSLYGSSGVAARIKDEIAVVDLNGITIKRFHDDGGGAA